MQSYNLTCYYAGNRCWEKSVVFVLIFLMIFAFCVFTDLKQYFFGMGWFHCLHTLYLSATLVHLLLIIFRKPYCSFSCSCILQLYGIASAVCKEERYVIKFLLCIFAYSYYTSMVRQFSDLLCVLLIFRACYGRICSWNDILRMASVSYNATWFIQWQNK